MLLIELWSEFPGIFYDQDSTVRSCVVLRDTVTDSPAKIISSCLRSSSREFGLFTPRRRSRGAREVGGQSVIAF